MPCAAQVKLKRPVLIPFILSPLVDWFDLFQIVHLVFENVQYFRVIKHINGVSNKYFAPTILLYHIADLADSCIAKQLIGTCVRRQLNG